MANFWQILFLVPVSVFGQCVAPACPVGGIWSEWVATAPCPTTCGACSNTTFTRTCISTAMAVNCPCVGDTSRIMVCNTQTCNWPRVNAVGLNCCKGTPTVISNWNHCAPLPDNYTMCCPDGGYWSTWSGYSKVANQAAWQRTRTCLSGGHGCPCKGDSVLKTLTCPCKPVALLTDLLNTCDATSAHNNPWTVRSPIFMNSRCQTQVVLELTNFRNDFWTTLNEPIAGDNFTGTIGYIDSTNKCRQVILTGADGTVLLGSSGQFLKSYLDCDLISLYFGGKITGKVSIYDVAAFAQFW